MPTSFRKKTALLSPKPGTPAPKASVRLFSSPGLSETIRNPVIKTDVYFLFALIFREYMTSGRIIRVSPQISAE